MHQPRAAANATTAVQSIHRNSEGADFAAARDGALRSASTHPTVTEIVMATDAPPSGSLVRWLLPVGLFVAIVGAIVRRVLVPSSGARR